MHTEGPPLRRDPQQGGQELGQVVRQGTELVDHHDQAGERAGREPDASGHAVVGEDPFAAAQLRTQPGQRPRGQAGLEVGDLADHVRQPPARTEARTTLEVDEHEGEVGG